VDVLGALVSNGKLGAHKKFIDKPVDLPYGEFNGRRWRNDGPHKVGE
jgi:agmatinase